MKRYLVTICLLLHGIVYADEATLQFEQANQLYRNGEYGKAAEAYEQILVHGYESSELHYNLGNTYFKLHNLPASILSYERAKRLAPRDADVDHNLRLAQLRIVDRIDPLPRLFFVEWWEAGTNVFTSDQWAAVAVIALWSLAIAGTLFAVGQTGLRRVASLVSFVAFMACVLAFLGALQRTSIEKEQAAIVFSPSVSVKSAPDRQSTELFLIHEGLKVELLDKVGDWHKVRLADGKVGWLPEESIEII